MFRLHSILADLPSDRDVSFSISFVYRKVNATWEMQQQGQAWEYYFWNADTQAWNKVEWLWTIENVRNIPYPGMGVGKASILCKASSAVFMGWL